MPAVTLRRYTPLILQINKVRENRTTCGANKARVQAFIHRGHHIRDMPLTALQQGHNLPFALPAMTNHPAHKLTRVFNCGAMGWIINAVVAVL